MKYYIDILQKLLINIKLYYLFTDFCNARPIDLVFSLDESGSIGSANFRKMKDFVNQIIDKLPIEDGNFSIGVTKFQSSASTVFNLNTFSTKSAMKNAVNATNYNSGGTNIASAINLIQNVSFLAKNGARYCIRISKPTPLQLLIINVRFIYHSLFIYLYSM